MIAQLDDQPTGPVGSIVARDVSTSDRLESMARWIDPADEHAWWRSRRRITEAATVIVAAAVVVAFFATLDRAGEDLADDLDSTFTLVRQALLLSVVAGLGSLAIVEVRKNLLGARGLFHRAHLGVLMESAFIGPDESRRGSVWNTLDMPLERVVGVLADRADTLINSGVRYHPFFQVLLGREAEDHESIYRDRGEGYSRHGDDHAMIWLRGEVDSRLSLLQVSVGNAWRRRVRLEAALLAGLIGFVAAAVEGGLSLALPVATISATLFGGFFAWLARDVVAAIERWRR